MSTPNNIFVSSVDLRRLETLIESMPGPNSAVVQSLEEELGRATILDPEQMPRDVVTMNSTVQFVIEPTGKTFKLTLVYPKDTDGSRNDVVSVFAPIGSALLGLSVGQTIDWLLPGGRTTTVRVVDVVYQPEREGNYHE